MSLLSKLTTNWVVGQSKPTGIPDNAGSSQDCRSLSIFDSKVPLLKTTARGLIELGELELVPTESLHPLCLLNRKGLCIIPKEKHKHQPDPKPFDLQCCPACNVSWHKTVAQSLWKQIDWQTCFDLRPTPRDGTHTQHCLGDDKNYNSYTWDV